MEFKDRIHRWFNCKTKIALFFFLCFFGGSGLAQSPLVFKSYTVNEGLSHNFVRKTIQDSEGFIWIATVDGLNRFDGYTFKIYKAKPDDSVSLPSSNILALTEDKNGNLWVGTGGGGLCIYNRKLDNFHRIPIVKNANDSFGIAANFIHCLYSDARGRVWIGTNNDGLFRASPDKLTFAHYLHDPGDPNSLSHDEISSITGDASGKLWIGTRGGGLDWFAPETGKFTNFRSREGDEHSLSANYVNVVFYDSKKRLWVGTNDRKLNLMKDVPGRFTSFQHHLGNSNSLGDYETIAIGENLDGKVWIGSNFGLYVYNEEKGNFEWYTHEPFDLKSLSSNQIKSINQDRQGSMWVGTLNGGVNLFDKSFVKILHYYHMPDKTSLSFDDVTDFVEDEDGKILIGTESGGMNIFDRKMGKFTRFLHDPDDPGSIGGDVVKSLLMDRKGRIWVGLWAGGIDQFDREKQLFSRLNIGGEDHSWLRTANVTCLVEDNDGMIWASTWGRGVVRFDPDKNLFEHFHHDEDNPHSLGERRAWAILCDRKNNIWVGNSNGILDRYDRENGRFVHFDTQEPGESITVILAVFEDTKGRIWIGSEGGGLQLFDRQKHTFKTYNTEDGLPSSYISSIEEDEHGNLWLGTNNGIARFNPETREVDNYGLRYGLQSLQFNRLSSIRLSSGEMMFGGVNGFNLFHPDNLMEKPQNIPIVFTDFQVFNKPVPIGGKDSPLQAHINETPAIVLSHKQSVFSIEYAGLHFPDPENIQYKYRLKGFIDENWQKVGKERKVTYTNLDPGEFVFEVTTDNGSTENSTRTLSITVTPPWWQTWWTRLLTGLVLSASLLTFYKLRLRSIKAHNKRLEREVEERTVSLRQANDVLREMNKLIQEQKEEIQAQAEELEESNMKTMSVNQMLEEMVDIRTTDLKKSNQELDNFVYRVSHDIRAPLSSMLGLVELMKNKQNLAQLDEYLNMTTKSINKLDNFVKDILDYSRNSRMQVESQMIDFPQLIESTFDELQYMDKAQQLCIIREFQLTSPFYSDPRRLHIIFRNLFSNAIKYQNPTIENSFLRVKIASAKEGVIIVLEDNGIGIAAEYTDRVFDMFFRCSEVSKGSGIGLYIVKETVEKLCGKIKLESQLGIGTVIALELPNFQSKLC